MIATADLETDPFEYGKTIEPFALGFHDGTKTIIYWGNACIKKFLEHLATIKKKLIIYMHNGGRFDLFWFLKYIKGNARIINNRIVSCRIGIHEFRDSFAILPVPLRAYKKTDIDYQKLRRAVRESHKDEIISYLSDDCTFLYELVVLYHAEFGPKLTIGGTAMGELKARHTFEETTEMLDAEIREKFYYGGRNQVFKAGIIREPIQIYDVNSMYPFVMKSFLHPISGACERASEISDKTAFVTVEGQNLGAFPTRLKDGSLDFTVPAGRFHVTIHEYNAGIDTGTFKLKRFIDAYNYETFTCFDTFVDHFYELRLAADRAEDEIHKLFYKLVLNSAYGKFAQNPENYYDWAFATIGTLPGRWHDCFEGLCPDPCPDSWEPAFISQNEYILWKRPIQQHKYYNVATGASITGAARSLLLRGLAATAKPYYVDTDSIICGGNFALPTHETNLGAWKKELKTPARTIAICGKKLYAVFDGADHEIPDKKTKKIDFAPDYGNVLKKAHKGARLTGKEILKIAGGAKVTYENPVPVFKWDGSQSFIKRDIKRTA